MKLNRFFALVLTLCMLFSLAQFPVSAEEICFEASGSLSSAASPLYTYSSQEEINLEEYYIKDVALPSSPTIKSTEYYANSLTADQKQYYRAIMDGFTGISDSSLRLKQAVCVTYSKKYSVTISTQAQLQVFLNNKLNTEMNGLDIQTIYNAIQYDHTELFWMRGMVCTVAADASADGTSVTVNYYVYFLVDSSDLFASDSVLRTAAKAMTSQVSSIISNTPSTSEYDKLVYFNKWLKENNTYNHTHLENNNYPLAHTAYSAFTSNSDEPTGPVCQGYAYALKYLCDKAGIHSVIVTGDLCQTGAAPGPHAWNAVELDGKWYAIDTTANDSLGTDVYNFLAGSSTASHDAGYPTFSDSHVTDDVHTYPTLSLTAYEPPAPCTHSYDNDCDSTCNDCGETRETSHTYDNDCDAECNVCGEERTVGDHKYDNDCDAECNVCGEERTVGDHKYDNNCDTKCNICGKTRTITHTYDNDCDAICNICGASRAMTAIEVTPLRSSTEMEGHSIDKTIDGSDTTGFVTNEFVTSSGTPSGAAYVVFDLKAQQRIEAIVLKWGLGTWGYCIPDEYRVLVSADDVTYTEIKHYVGLRDIESGDPNTYPDVLTITGSVINMKKATVNETRLNLENVRYIKVEIVNWKNRVALTEIEVSTTKELHTYDNDQDTTCNECGAVREVAAVRLPGDVNGDDIVNNKDFGILRQYLNNWEVTINESNADVNADGIVNNKDMGILRQYLNNWDVELL